MGKKELSKLLKKYRNENGLSITQLIEKLDFKLDCKFSTGTISKWENGIHLPHEDYVEALAEVLGADKNTFLQAAGYPQFPQEEPLESAKEKKISDDKLTVSIEIIRLSKHWEELANVAKSLNVSKWDEHGETLLDGGELQEQLDSAYEYAAQKYGNLLFSCFESHLDAELKASGQEWEPEIVIDTAAILAHGMTFKGKCKICKDW